MKKAQAYILSFVWLIPFFMVLGTVFVVNPELGNGVVSGKYVWFYLSMGVVAVTSVWMVIHSPSSLQVSGVDGLILLFGVITLPVSYWLHHSEAVTKHILLLLIILLYFYFKLQRKQQYWLVLFFLMTGFVESSWGLRQLYGFDSSQHSWFRLTGSFFNPGPYACSISVVLPAAFYYMLRHWYCTKAGFKLRYWPVYLRWGVSLLTVGGALLVLPAAMSRTSWLAAAGGCGLVTFFHFAKNEKVSACYHRYKKRALLILSCLFFCILLGGAGMYYLKKDSADGRLLMWKISLQTLVHHPAGVGIGHFSGSYGDEQAAYFASGKGTEQEEYVAGNPESGFNEYLQICIEQGVVPFMLFLSLVLYSVYRGVKRKRIAATASLLALLITAMTSYPFSVLPFLIAFAFLLAWIHSGKESKRFSPPVSVGFAAGCLLVVMGSAYNRYPTYKAYKEWGKSRFMYHSRAYEQAGETYALLYPELADQLPFLFEYAQCLSKSGRHEESNKVLKKAVRISCDPMLYNIMGKNHQAMKRYVEAEHCFLKAAHIVPNRLYPWYLLAKLYVETGETDKAMATAQIVLTKEPKVQSTAVREMRDEMKKLLGEGEADGDAVAGIGGGVGVAGD
jgi:tetratricopeptide (TPR) repeat protein